MRSYEASEDPQREAQGRRLPQRFLASHAGGLGDKVYGVWDVGRQAWHTPDKMTDDAAERLAADLSARHSPTGPRPDTEWRHLDPPVPIDVKFLTWKPAELDYWVREPDGWYGHVRQPGSEPRWYPAELLRPRHSDDPI